MAHDYSVEIHNYLKKKIEVAEQNKKKAEDQNDADSHQFYKGQLEELFSIREFLTERIDLKTQTSYQ